MGIEISSDALVGELEAVGREQALEAANRAFSSSQDRLTAGGDEHDYETFPVVQSGTPPQWDEQRNGAVFSYDHPASIFFEVGTQTHEIVADGETLVFEWPDAPPEVQQMFKSTFPTVFFPRVKVDGIERIDYVSDGLDDAADWLEGQ